MEEGSNDHSEGDREEGGQQRYVFQQHFDRGQSPDLGRSLDLHQHGRAAPEENLYGFEGTRDEQNNPRKIPVDHDTVSVADVKLEKSPSLPWHSESSNMHMDAPGAKTDANRCTQPPGDSSVLPEVMHTLDDLKISIEFIHACFFGQQRFE
ncbi:hypothetical protein K439DRAFT_1615329 [Ramaria rubella]|nr:hypothetical protein K439DRAFT_1615329 [Ramaria rubella]